jgi:hypothetical protein
MTTQMTPTIGLEFKMKGTRFAERIYRITSVDNENVYAKVIRLDPSEITTEAIIDATRFMAGAVEP